MAPASTILDAEIVSLIHSPTHDNCIQTLRAYSSNVICSEQVRYVSNTLGNRAACTRPQAKFLIVCTFEIDKLCTQGSSPVAPILVPNMHMMHAAISVQPMDVTYSEFGSN